jgi:nicotinate-nucleotide adenylyltransferase
LSTPPVASRSSGPARIGFFGGTFDPPHRGHLALARLARQTLRLQKVLVAPVAAQPLKRGRHATAYSDRLAMTRLAMAGEPGMELSDADAPRVDGKPNYMLETLRDLETELTPGTQVFVICGADAFLTIREWYCAEELLMRYPFVIGARPGFDLSRIAQALPESISVAAEENREPELLTLGLRDEKQRHSMLYLLPDLSEDISATELREALRKPGVTPEFLDGAVLRYIREHGLYED